jgi:hypothetical protein
MHFHTEDDPMATAGQLPAHGPRGAAQGCLAIACDHGVADEVRLSAAEQLAALGSRAAAEPS